MFGKTLKSISIALLLIILASAAKVQAQTYATAPGGISQTCATAPVGLVAAYSGDGNALDARSRSNGTIQGNVTYAAGEVGQAFNFGGANGDRVLVGNPANLQLQNFTIEAWIKRSSSSVVTNSPNAGSPGGIFFAYGQNGYAFLIDQATGKLGLSAVGQSQVLAPTLTITDTNWHHVAVTQAGPPFTGGTQTIFYLDGVADTPVGYAPQFSFTTNAAIGSRGDAQTDNVFFGAIDELAIYDRALSAAQIAGIFNSGTSGKCKPIATNAPDNQVLWLAGDGDANDSSGSGNNGTLQSSAGFAVGKVGQGFKFNGTFNSYVEVPDSPSLRPTNALTMEAWINSDIGTNSFNFFLYKGNGSSAGGQPYSMFLNSTFTNTNRQLGARVGNDSTFDTLFSTSGIPVNTFTHVAVTYDGTTIRMYINGVLDASKTTTIGTLAQLDTNPLTIGSGAGSRFFGAVDEVGIYNRVLSAAEIQSIATAGLAGKYKVQANVPANIAAWYPGDGNTNDLQAANNGTLNGGATYANGKVGQAFSLNGTNAYVSAPSTAANDPTGAGTGASMEAWAYFNQLPSAAGQQFYVISKTGASGTDGFDIHVDPDNFFKFVWQGSYSGFANSQVQTGVWYHVLATFSPTAGVKFYVNGVLQGTANVFNPRTVSNAPLDIGHSTALGGSKFFNGLIDEPAIYSRALTQDEIRDQYYAGSLGKYKGAANPTILNTTKTGEAIVTFGSITNAGAVHLTPLNNALLPVLPMGTNTGLNFDVSTTAAYTNPMVCFKVPSFTPAQFANLRIYHLESGAWQNRTGTGNVYPNLCTNGLTSLSPFAISMVAPSAANVSISGRITTANGGGIRNVRVSLTTPDGAVYQTLTGSFGYYKFSELLVGQTYVLSVAAKKYTFANPTRIIDLQDDLADADFVANDGGFGKPNAIK